MSTELSDKTAQSLVSVLVPIYNVEKYLCQCLDSLVNQTLKNLEIILINDGSKDSSLNIIKSYASKDPRIVVVDKPNSGYGCSMNIGLEKATGKYVGIVESDDWIEPDMFEVLYNLSEKNNLDISRSEFFFYSTVDGEKNRISKTDYVPHDKVIAPCDERSVFMQQPSIWANLYRRSFLNENKIRFLETPGASYQDTAFSFKVYACASRFEMIGRAFYHYRIDGGSSSFQNTTKVYCICDEYEEIWKFVRNHGLYEKYRYLIPRMQYNGYKWNYERLAQPYCDEFFGRWHEEFTKLNDEGNLNPKSYRGMDTVMISNVLSGNIPDKSKPLVSIIVPVYNTEKYLEKCLNSLVNQTLKDIEIICINDGSTDGSQQIIDKFSKMDSRVISIIKKNGGQSSARNAGLKIARGKYIGFVDSDDWAEPGMFERAVIDIGDTDAAIMGINIVGDAMMNRRKDDLKYYSINYSGKVDLTSEILFNTHVSAWNKLYRTDIIRKHGLEFPEGLLYEDYCFFWEYFGYCRTAFYDATPCYNYVRREGSIMYKTLQDGNRRAIEHMEIFEKVYNYFSEHRDAIHLSDSGINKMFLNCFWFAYFNIPANLKKKVLKLGTKQVRKMNLKGDGVIDALREKEYGLVDVHKNYSCKARFFSRLISKAECAVGGDFSSLKKMLFGTYRNSTDRSDSVATTDWVFRHETDNWIERWSVIYDSNSDSEFLNWNRKGGFSGKNSLEIHDSRKSVFAKGTELKIHVTLEDTKTAVMQAPIIDDTRAIWGASFYDGQSVFVASVDIDLKYKKIWIRAINTTTKQDVSEFCKVLRIESRIY